jgi:uncharacterized protein YraI
VWTDERGGLMSKDPPFDGHTTGTLLRVRTGPGLKCPTLRLIEHKGTPIVVREQVAGSVVAGNDRWDRIGEAGPTNGSPTTSSRSTRRTRTSSRDQNRGRRSGRVLAALVLAALT